MCILSNTEETGWSGHDVQGVLYQDAYQELWSDVCRALVRFWTRAVREAALPLVPKFLVSHNP